MEKTGSLAEIVLASYIKDWSNKEAVEQSTVSKRHTAGLNKTLQGLKSVGKSNDIDLILRVENAQLEIEKTINQQRDPSVLPSLEAAVVDFSVMSQSLQAVRSSEYQQVEKAHHSKRKNHGVPQDGFHEAINSHITRLGNQLRAVGLSVPEKNIIRQRQENMRTAKKLYIGLQCEALGIEPPAKSKGLER